MMSVGAAAEFETDAGTFIPITNAAVGFHLIVLAESTAFATVHKKCGLLVSFRGTAGL